MGKENGRGRSRRRKISRARKFLNREGKKLCASALCVSMLFGSVMNTTIAANKKTENDEYEFELSRASLYQALQNAVLTGSTVDEELEFQGDAAEEYRELLAPGGSLYELKPELEDNDGSLRLRVFAKLDQEIELDSEYEAAGTEEIMFLLTNRSDEPQKAVIYVDDKYTEEIEVAPGEAIAVSEDEAAQGPADGGTAGGGASSGGGAAGGENAAAAETTGAADENGQTPEGGEVPAQPQPEETTGAQEETDGDVPGDVEVPTEETGNAAGDESQAEGSEDAADGSGQTEESGAAVDENGSTAAEDGNASSEDENAAGEEENGADGSGDTAGSDVNSGEAESGNQTDTGSSENAGNSSAESGSGSSAAGSESGSAGNGSVSGNDSAAGNTGADSNGGNDSSGSVSDSSDSGNGSASEGEKTVAASISLHRASLVAAPAEEDPIATDSELPVATDSELATDSEMEKLIDGDLYEAVRLKEDGAVLFVTTLDDLGVMDGWGPIVFGQQFEQEIDGFRVRAIARKGVLPDDAEMSVVQLTPEEHPDQYNEAVNALAEAGTQYEGMAALDISFHDSEGTEIEPNGEVQVSIELKEGTLPEDADPSTVVVQHLKETGEAIKVEKVADASNDTDGIVALADELTDPDEIEVSDEAQAVAAFRVESFSTFTITWNGWTGYFNKKISFQLYTEDNGEYKKITGVSDFEITEDHGYEVVIAEKAVLEGYTYLRAEYWENNIKQYEIDKIRADKDGIMSWKVEVHKSGTGENGWISVDENRHDLRLIYSEDTVAPPVTPERELSKTKKVRDNSDGTYDLELSISGAVGTIQNKAPLDILFIVDISNSMSWGMKGEYSSGPSRISYVKTAINNLIDSISENDGIDARYNVVTFKSSAGELTDGWVDNAQSVKNDVNGIYVRGNAKDGGTDYTKAISKGNAQLADVRSEANSVVIFLSDGEPDNNNYANIRQMSCTYFYAIGVGSSFNTPSSSASKTLKYLCDNVGATNKGNDPYLATDTSSLEQAFEDIALDATTILCNNVIISDKLSENVEAVLNDLGPESLTVTVLDENGNIHIGPSSSITLPETEENSAASLTPTYDVNTKTISLIFPEEYKLEKGWTYKVNLKVAATDQAYKNLQDPEYEKAVGDKDTGTYSEKEGLYSNVNDKATVTYAYNGENPTEYFPKPVIQLTVADLTINKKVQGLDDDKALEELKSELKFLIRDSEDKVVREISYRDFTNGVKTIEDLKPGTYTVSESGFDDIDGYTFKTPNDQVSQTIKIEIGQDNQVSFTNKYAKDLIIPTGIFNDKLPYLLMSGVAILCTAGVLFNSSIKRRRENEE